MALYRLGGKAEYKENDDNPSLKVYDSLHTRARIIAARASIFALKLKKRQKRRVKRYFLRNVYGEDEYSAGMLIRTNSGSRPSRLSTSGESKEKEATERGGRSGKRRECQPSLYIVEGKMAVSMVRIGLSHPLEER